MTWPNLGPVCSDSWVWIVCLKGHLIVMRITSFLLIGGWSGSGAVIETISCGWREGSSLSGRCWRHYGRWNRPFRFHQTVPLRLILFRRRYLLYCRYYLCLLPMVVVYLCPISVALVRCLGVPAHVSVFRLFPVLASRWGGRWLWSSTTFFRPGWAQTWPAVARGAHMTLCRKASHCRI